MGIQFDWQVDEQPIPVAPPRKKWLGRLLVALLAITLLALLKPQSIPLPADPPPMITFAVPADQLGHFQTLARAFTDAYPDQTIIVVDEQAIAAEPESLLLQVDAAVLSPDVALLQTGLVYPLDQLGVWDDDFYPQLTDGVVWDEHIWVWPYAAQINLLYVDRATVNALALDDPAAGWHFWRFGRQIDTIAAETDLAGYLLSSRDLLFSYAYAHAAAPLDETAVANTLAWRTQLMTTADAVYDLSDLASTERMQTHLRTVSADRRAAVWITHPGLYEYHTQLDPVTIAPYPYNDDFESVAPLHIHGSVVSRTSQNPLLAMQWLDFISHHPPPGGERLIPARQSVAQAQRYWQILPSVMRPLLRDAFATAQAITIADHSTLTWERINLGR